MFRFIFVFVSLHLDSFSLHLLEFKVLLFNPSLNILEGPFQLKFDFRSRGGAKTLCAEKTAFDVSDVVEQHTQCKTRYFVSIDAMSIRDTKDFEISIDESKYVVLIW
jgi:hypothetical protein